MGLFDFLFGDDGEHEGEQDIEAAIRYPDPEEGTIGHSINEAAGFNKEDFATWGVKDGSIR